MSDTLFLVLAILQIFAIFLYAGPIMARHLLYISLKKNPNWASQKENQNSYKFADIIYTWWSRLIATVSGASLIYFVILNPEPKYYNELAMIPIFVWSLSLIALMAYVYGYLLRVMPKPEVVKATLSSRRLSDYFPLWIFYIAYGIFALICIYYAYQYGEGVIEVETLYECLRYTLFISIITFGTLLFTLKRKHSEFDLMFEAKGRRYEVIVNIVGIYILVMVSINKMLIDIYQLEILSQNMVSLILGFSVNLFFLWVVSHPKSKEITKDYHLKYVS